jgi:2-polyprenyl-3-methyl-5-hydroxy-6-metoxy-1,4-benzoquinol methylase
MLETMVEKKQAVPDLKKVEEFAGQVIIDLGACLSGVLNLMGHELGLYKAMDGQGFITPKELAERTGTYERYVREWLNNQTAGGYINYDPATKRYALPVEHAMVLAAEEGPAFMTSGFYIAASAWSDREKFVEAFKTGNGMGWHEHHHDLFFGTEALFRSGYKANLIESWIPLLNGVNERLKLGGRVADVGCGHGASTILMAEYYPNAQFYGFDYHPESIDVAKKRAKEKGLTNVTFIKASADEFGEGKYDLICFMDSFHDMGNPLKAAMNARNKLSRSGSLMIVEPASSDNIVENFNPIGRMYYAASTTICVPNSHSQEGDYGLGAQAGVAKVAEIIKEAGFKEFRIAHKTPVNLVYEANL